MVEIRRYNAENAGEWNRFVTESKNGTFLLNRSFMEYHSDRFADASLLFYEGKRLIALLPANYDDASKTLFSHQGLTYGGLIMSAKTTAKTVINCFSLIKDFAKNELGAVRIIYKPIPYIYSTQASEEDLYALFRNDASLVSRGLSSCIDLQNRIPVTESRKSGLRKAISIEIRETDDIDDFWRILNEVLTTNHNTAPVHTPAEMRLLMSRFYKNIRLFAAYGQQGKMLAGAWVFDCGKVIHTQYLAASAEGKSTGALDKLIYTLINDIFRDRHYLDFGISTEQQGHWLNEGLIFQKEGFGGRGICYDTYEINI